MFDVTENFALAIRLNYVHLSAGGMSINLTPDRKGAAQFTARFYSQGKSASNDYADERDVWASLAVDAPWVLEAARTDENLYMRGLAMRAQMLNSMSDVDFQARMAEFERIPLLMWDAVLSQLGGKYLAKAKLKPRATATSKGISWCAVRGKVALPHYEAPELMHVRFFPSPVEDNVWSMQLGLHSKDRDTILRNQHALRGAIAEMRTHGIEIGDVVNGTLLSL
jgi:hypothetical protein